MCKAMIFIGPKVGKYQRPGLLLASSYDMSNKIKTYIIQIMSHLFHNTFFAFISANDYAVKKSFLHYLLSIDHNDLKTL